MTVWISVDTTKQANDKDRLMVFANSDTAETWFEETAVHPSANRRVALK